MNTEVTFQVLDSLESVRKNIEANGFVLDQELVLIDDYYANLSYEEILKTDYLNLLNNSVLTRQAIYEDASKNGRELCYKIKELNKDGNVVSETKVKVKLDNVNNMQTILNNLKLTHWCNCEAKLYFYKNNNIEFLLQDVKGLGLFIEVEEYDEIKHLSNEEKIEKLIKLVKSQNFKTGDDYNCKKPFMILHKK